jgi:hypothetical protein
MQDVSLLSMGIHPMGGTMASTREWELYLSCLHKLALVNISNSNDQFFFNKAKYKWNDCKIL